MNHPTYQSVVECRSALRVGYLYWIGKLACGCEFRKIKSTQNSRVTKPAPLRMKCDKHPGGSPK